MDLDLINDMDKLKVLAYDQLLAKGQAEHNLKLIDQRMQVLEQEAAKEAPKK
jgi:hypothetical protein